MSEAKPDVGWLYQRVEALLGGEWRPGTVMNGDRGRVRVDLDREHDGERTVWLPKGRLRPRADHGGKNGI